MSNEVQTGGMRWNMNNDNDNVTSSSLSLSNLQAGQKRMVNSFVCLFVHKITQFIQLPNIYVTIQPTFLQIPLWFPNNTSGLCANWWCVDIWRCVSVCWQKRFS